MNQDKDNLSVLKVENRLTPLSYSIKQRLREVGAAMVINSNDKARLVVARPPLKSGERYCLLVDGRLVEAIT